MRYEKGRSGNPGGRIEREIVSRHAELGVSAERRSHSLSGRLRRLSTRHRNPNRVTLAQKREG